MSQKNKSKNPRLQWPKTPTQRLKEAVVAQDQASAVAALGQVSQIMTAANAVPMPLAKHMLSQAVQAASVIDGAIPRGSKKKKGKKSWEVEADDYFDQNKAWDEVNGLYVGCVDLLRTSMMLTPLLRETELLKLVVNKRLLTRNVKAIVRDTQALSVELTKIHNTHKDRSGGSKNQEDMMDSCQVFSNYVNFMERYDSALMPLVVHTSEQLQEALILMESTNPELASTLTKNLLGLIGNVRSIVHEVTGAEATPTPVAAVTEEAIPA